MRSPVESVARWVIPMSTPTLACTAVGIASGAWSTANVTQYRPVGSLETMTSFGSAVGSLRPRSLTRLRQLSPLTDDNLLIFRDRTPKGRHYTERPGDPPTGLQDSSFGAGCFGNAKSS